jgi:phosphoserine aminotransferase
MTARPHNFNAGPAILPLEVMAEVQAELLDTHGTGLSILEWSHRSKPYDAIRASLESRLFRLLGLPAGHPYRLLTLQGGASEQFAMVPLNLASTDRVGGYVVTGVWAKKAIEEAERLKLGKTLWSGKSENFGRIPADTEWSFSSDLSYVHITTNNTIFGTEWHSLPKTGGVPLVLDASSDILSRPIPMEGVGVIYAGAQKNLGPAGLTPVIVREDLLLNQPPTWLPAIWDYRVHLKAEAIYNTPPTFAVYLMDKVLKWIEDHGGLSGMERRNGQKAAELYAEIDRSGFYRGTCDRDSRSRMNVCFRLPDEPMEARFLDLAKKEGFVGLPGHRSVGGCRASLYNALPIESVRALVSFMQEFERTHG